MIVDLVRNDLGRVAQTGSVRVEELFAVERYPTLWQMTSTVSAELRPEAGFHDIFRALFPCGSVTGAPKVRAMQLIAELEDAPRGVYTGAIGFFSPRQTVFNVAIRTLELDGDARNHGGRQRRRHRLRSGRGVPRVFIEGGVSHAEFSGTAGAVFADRNDALGWRLPAGQLPIFGAAPRPA